MRLAFFVGAFSLGLRWACAASIDATGTGWLPPNESVSWIGGADVSVTLQLVNRGLTPEDPPSPWDGAHLALRYQDECRTYYVSLNRRDGLAVVKKKIPDGLSSCGGYVNLGDYALLPVPYGRVQSFKAVIRDEEDGSVSIKLFSAGRLVASGRDTGVGGPPIREAGEIVLRSDNAELEYERVSIQPATPAPAPKTFVSKPQP